MTEMRAFAELKFRWSSHKGLTLVKTFQCLGQTNTLTGKLEYDVSVENK